MPLPRLDAIAADLRQVVKHGVGAIPDTTTLSTLSGLLWVQQVTQGSGSLDTIIAAERLITEAIATLEGTPPHGALQLLFGLTPATTGALAKHRRRAAATAFGADVGTFNRHDEQRLIRLLARRIYALETDEQLTHDRLGPPPNEDEVRASWSARFSHYHRMQSILRQLRFDLIAVLLTQTEHPDQRDREDYLDSSIWNFARFLLAHDRFVDELGGIWLMPHPAADAVARTSTELVLWQAPFNERGRSWLRTALVQVPGGELYPLAARLRDGPDGTEVLGVWEGWLSNCDCDPDRPMEHCRAHQVVENCDRYVGLVDEQWARVREIFRAAPSTTAETATGDHS